ncbi:MAG: hypothetical protein NZ901_11275 [Geminocystis sp.]|nr:hypothetical protein [Geminocystis sp.]MCS7148751.1 hypothetical protein [Geminocystis sp.]MDW8116100.1 hypothetical protein [Geminocystis sp.]MDW8463560.1 hypothetical protein [Geminocystis sp.]
MMYGYLSFGCGFSFLLIVAFFVLQWFNIPVGNFVDWLIGIAIFWWLLAIVTIPWNIYFDAQDVMAEANVSRQKNISFDEKQLEYVQKVASFSIVLAIVLHLLSALGLYLLAASGVSEIGYLASGATLLLTFLRPAVRGYHYLAQRLQAIREQITHPREDVLELRNRVLFLENQLKSLVEEFNYNNEDSLVFKNEQRWQEIRNNYNQLMAKFEHFQALNKQEHENIIIESRKAVAQLSEDSKFLENVREIIRFFKGA